MIDFEHVTKIYKRSDKPALEDIDFHVADGEFVFLVGHSGAGKSTLLKLILREELPTEGRVLVDGKDVARLRRGKVPYLRRQMGIIFQDFRLIPTMTVYENIAFAMHVTNIGKKDIKERVNYMLELVHLEDKAKVYPEFLSGGEQQRVAVARALAHSPRLVIADEPTGNIDPEMSLEMMELLERVSAAPEERRAQRPAFPSGRAVCRMGGRHGRAGMLRTVPDRRVKEHTHAKKSTQL